ncbi:MAG: multidrug ABC transporter permease [Tetrasphaera sp.]
MSAVTGTRTLTAASIRQDARNIAPWVMLISVLSASSILAYRWIFTDLNQRRELAMTLGANPALSLVFGKARDMLTPDGFNAWRAGMLGALFAGLMAILIVVRNSRAQEDSGQAELLAANVLGRQSRLMTAVLMAVIASVALGVACFLLTWLSGGEVASTAMISATFTASGLMFAGVAAVSSQLGSDSRSASAMAIGALGVLYAVRGYVDSSTASEWAGWITPLGWLEQTEPSVKNDPWPLGLALALAVILVALAFMLQRRRDFGFGLIPLRPGPAEGGWASTVWGLPLRLHRGALIGWLIGLTGMGLLFGNLVTSIGEVIAQNPAMGQILASGAVTKGGITAAFVATVLQLIGIVAAIMGVQIIMRIYAEETDYRVEPLLAAPLRRPIYLASNVILAVVATAIGMVLAGTGLGWVASRASEATLSWGDVVRQALVTVPAVWVLVGLATAAVGAKPSRRLVGWLGILATFGLTLLGPTFKLPDYILAISPLCHVPIVNAAAPDWSGLGWLALAILVFLTVGFAGYRRRDII